MKKPDFSGWATKNNLKCSDGRVIMTDAFKENDGQTVPLVWNHQHNEPFNVLGHCDLHNLEDGVYTEGYLNDTEQGRNAKMLLEHGDISALSIYANQLKQRGSDVVHGVIREVSLVLAGANPGAFIDSVSLSHGEDSEEEAIIYTGEDIVLSHSDNNSDDEKKGESEDKEGDKKEKSKVGDEKQKTIKEVFDTLTEDQKTAVYVMLAEAARGGGKDDDDDDDEEKEGGDSDMKHNVFEGNQNEDNFLSHADMEKIFNDAKRLGSLREAVQQNIEDGILAHSIDTTDMETATGTQIYGFNDPSMLFPDYKALSNTPEWISRNMDWVQKVMGGVHHTPFSRIKSVYANITEDDARARGYIKGRQKKEEVFTTLKRTTNPQTIYKKQKLDRDDIIDITDFDVVAWIRAEMRVMLNEEIARAILIGDGRAADSDDKIQETNVRPIAKDVPLFNIKHAVEVDANASDAQVAKKTVDEAVRARKDYKGSGNPTFFTTEDVLTEMLLMEDGIGHKYYKTEAELATALRVREIVTVEAMENQEITVDGSNYDLLGVIVNMSDYNVGADKGGEINMFDDFDIDYNQQKYLIETRISGALTKPYSAITLYKKPAA